MGNDWRHAGYRLVFWLCSRSTTPVRGRMQQPMMNGPAVQRQSELAWKPRAIARAVSLSTGKRTFRVALRLKNLINSRSKHGRFSVPGKQHPMDDRKPWTVVAFDLRPIDLIGCRQDPRGRSLRDLFTAQPVL